MNEHKRVGGDSTFNSSDAEFVTIAKVIKTQGRKGEVAAVLLTDFPERFSSRKRLFALFKAGAGPTSNADRRDLQLENHWFHKDHVVFKFAGVDSMSQAEELVGSEIQVPRSERTKLGADSVYVSDLAGCAVYNGGNEIGKVADVRFGSGEAPLLVVQGEKEYLIPFASGYIKNLSLENKRLEMDLPEGMLSLDEPLSSDEKRRQKDSGRR